MILVLSIIATISAVVSAYCDVRGLRREKRMIEQDSSVPRLSTPRRHYVVMGLFLLLIWGAVAFDYYGYHDALQWPDPYQPISKSSIRLSGMRKFCWMGIPTTTWYVRERDVCL